MSPVKKSNDVLEEQIKMLFKMLEDNKKDYMGIFERIEKMLADIKNDSVTKEQLKSTLDLHEEKSRARHSELENDVTMMKRTLWWVVSTLGTTITALSVAIFNYYFK